MLTSSSNKKEICICIFTNSLFLKTFVVFVLSQPIFLSLNQMEFAGPVVLVTDSPSSHLLLAIELVLPGVLFCHKQMTKDHAFELEEQFLS